VPGDQFSKNVSIAEDGSSARVEVTGMDTADTGTVTAMTVTLAGEREGTAGLSVDVSSDDTELFDENGTLYTVDSQAAGFLRVGRSTRHGSAPDAAGGSVDTVILASTANYPDALVGAAAASKIGSPILLTDKGQLPRPTQNALSRMNPSDVIIVGGPAVVSNQVKSSLEQDYNVTRLWGTTRYGTAVEIAEHFWVEGADEAILVQNGLEERNGTVIAAAKDLARDDETPVYLTPEDSVPAVVLTSLQDLGVQQVTVVGPEVSDSYRSSLTEIGVSIDEEISGEDDRAVMERIQERTQRDLNRSEELLVVASNGFQHQIAAANFPDTDTFHVTSDEDIEELVALVNDEAISSVKVAGRPGLAEDAAGALRADTGARVRLVVAEAADAVRMNANLTEENIPAFAQVHRQRVQRWQQAREERQAFVMNRANKSLQRAKNLVDANASEEAQEALRKAETLFSAGRYVEAREEAEEAISEVREQRFEEMQGNATAIRQHIREETSDLQERVEELRELNQEFGKEMSENMTVEERLEVIDEFRNERREKVRELMKQARGTEGDIGKRLRQAEKRFEQRDRGANRRFETDIECTDEQVTELSIEGHDGRVQVEGTFGLSTPNYVPSSTVNVDRENNAVDVTITFAKRKGGLGIQCVANAEVEQRVGVAAGNWTVTASVIVDGEETVSQTRTVSVTPDDGDGMEEERDDEEVEEMEKELEDLNETENTMLPSSYVLESTDGSGCDTSTFYYKGEATDEVSMPADTPVSVTFAPRANCTYSGGAQFYSVPSSVFGSSDAVDGGQTTTVMFNASEDFTIEQWWPNKGQKKAELKVDIE
ncbi:MAG: cell wall-binding repeat-containing protein, partial [Candidatus Nanohaloarchaea archaeon]|nr:cell wall-binding repeat-containing protein [Candidatus Nanohaloarchaea archaeon]